MRTFVVLGGLALAVALGCGRKDKDIGDAPINKFELTPPGPPPVDKGKNGPVVQVPPVTGGKPPEKKEDSEAPPWPTLPAVAQRVAKYPDTQGGQVAWALDNAADHLVNSPRPPEGSLWTDFGFAGAFKSPGALIPTLPKRALPQGPSGHNALGPAGDASKDRELIDAAFLRVWDGWGHYRERTRRWYVEISEEVYRKKQPSWTARQRREAAESGRPPGREVKVEKVTSDSPATGSGDWVVLNVSGDDAGTRLNMAQTMAVTGKIQFTKKFVLDTGPVAAGLEGKVGQELHILVLGPAVIDLTGVQAPIVRVRSSQDVLIRVGPGVGMLEVSPRRGLILSRGAPNLRVEGAGQMAVVNY
jgi:hypothetical protein